MLSKLVNWSIFFSEGMGGGHHHHQSLFIHEIILFYMVFLGIVFKTRLKYSKELLTNNVKNTKTYIMNNKSYNGS